MIAKLIKSSLFLMIMIAFCASLKWMYHHTPYVREQHQIITEKSIDVRALFYTESEVGKNALIDIREESRIIPKDK